MKDSMSRPTVRSSFAAVLCGWFAVIASGCLNPLAAGSVVQGMCVGLFVLLVFGFNAVFEIRLYPREMSGMSYAIGGILVGTATLLFAPFAFSWGYRELIEYAGGTWLFFCRMVFRF